jgi:hypothetical protein
MSNMFEQRLVVPVEQKLRYNETKNDVRKGNKNGNTE